MIGAVLSKRNTLAGIFELPKDELEFLGLTPIIVGNIRRKAFDSKVIEREIYLATRNNVVIVTLESPDYPSLLKTVHMPPPYIYVKGNIACLKEPAIGIVGSRKCSKASADYTRKLASDLAGVGFTVVSGFAYGIDIEAHLGATLKGATAAVLGSGFLDIYPKQHIKYAEKILEQGCFISEFAFETPPHPINFPRRNRIISGLSLGIAVIEASVKSGSLITCRYALEQNREVFAVPHFPSSFNSAGNALIKDGAKLLETYLDIVSEFAYLLKSPPKTENVESQRVAPEFDCELKSSIYEALGLESQDVNELCMKIGVSITDIMVAATEMELEGYIEKGEEDRYFVSE